MDRAAHSSSSSILRSPKGSGPSAQPARFPTGFDADALSALKPSTPAPGSTATPPLDPGAGCVFLGGAASLPKDALLGSLRAAIRKIEGHVSFEKAGDGPAPQTAEWYLGAPAFDRLLPGGLDLGALHEVKAHPQAISASAGDWMTSLGFAVRLAVRRAAMLQDGTRGSQPWMLWCWPRALATEFGAPSMSGLAALGLDPARLVIVETGRASDACAALEDGLRSQALALAFGIFDDMALTPARRLSLAASASGTPCLLVTHPASEVSGATATRWRVGRHQSAPHAYDARAPGNARFHVALERCRTQPASAGHSSLPLEWCDETRTFSLASGMADCALGPRAAIRRAQG